MSGQHLLLAVNHLVSRSGLRLGLVLFCLLAPLSAEPAGLPRSFTWAAASTSNWNDPNNWSPNTGVPGVGPDIGAVVAINLSGTYTVLLDVPVELASLTIGPTTGSGTQTLETAGNLVQVSGLTQIFNTGELLLERLAEFTDVANAGTIRVHGSAGGVGRLAFTGTFTNDNLVYLDANATADAEISGPSLVQNAGGSLQTSDTISVGGRRILNCNVDNSGMISAAAGLEILGSDRTHYNRSGAVMASQVGTFLVDLAGTSANFYNQGDLRVTSLMLIQGSAFNNSGVIIDPNFKRATSRLPVTPQIIFLNTTLSGSFNTATVDFNFQGSCNLLDYASITNPGRMVVAGTMDINSMASVSDTGIIDITGTSNHGPAELVFNAGYTNAGIINLTSTALADAKLTVNGTLSNSGSINAEPGAGGARTIVATLDNTGILNANTDLAFNLASAAHSNSGAGVINANAGTLLFENQASFVNSNQMNTSAGSTIIFRGGTLDTSGTLAKSATKDSKSGGLVVLDGVEVINNTFNNSGNLVLINSNVAASASINNSGSLFCKGVVNIFGGLTNTGSVTVEGTSTYNDAHLIFANDWANNGTVYFTDDGAPKEVKITVNGNKLFHNAFNGTFETQVGFGGTRVIDGILNNQGIMNINYGLEVSSASDVAHVNTGSIHVNEGQLKVLMTPNSIFTNDPNGIIEMVSPGHLFIQGGSFHQNATLTLPALKRLPAPIISLSLENTALAGVINNSGHISIKNLILGAAGTLNNTGELVFRGSGNQVQGTLTNSGTITLDAQALDGDATLTLNNAFNNDGIIELNNNNGPNASLNGSATLTNRSPGIIRSQFSSGGNNSISVSLVNEATILALAHLDINVPPATTFTNSSTGIIRTDTVRLNIHIPDDAFMNNEGSIEVVPGAELDFDGAGGLGPGGIITNTGMIGTPVPRRPSRGGAPATVIFEGMSLHGTYTNTLFMRLIGATLGAGSSFTNQNKLELWGYNTVGGTFDNSTGAILELLGDTVFGDAIYNGPGFANEGNIQLSTTSISHTSELILSSTLTNQASGNILSYGVTSTPRVIRGTLENLGNISVDIDLDLSAGDAIHTNAGAIVVNNGTFRIVDPTAAPPLAIFVNTGILNVTGSGQVEVTDSELRNAFDANTPGSIHGTGTITSTNGEFTSGGHLAPGASPGLLPVVGNLSLTPDSMLDLEVHGPTPGSQYDQLTVTGTLTLDGTLNVDFSNYIPIEGDLFTVITGGSVIGTFSSVNAVVSNGLILVPQYDGTSVVLQAMPGGAQWNNASGGLWSDPNNWIPNVVPGPCSVVSINLPGTYTVTMDVPNVEVFSLDLGDNTGLQTLDLASNGLAVRDLFQVNLGGELIIASAAVANGVASCLGLPQRSRIGNPTLANLGMIQVIGDARFDIPFSNTARGTLNITGTGGAASSLTTALGFLNEGAINLGENGGGDATLTLESGLLENTGSIYAYSGSNRYLTTPISNNGSIYVGGTLWVDPTRPIAIQASDYLLPNDQTLAHYAFDGEETEMLHTPTDQALALDAGGSTQVEGAFHQARFLDGVDDEIDLTPIRQKLMDHGTWTMSWFSRSSEQGQPALQILARYFKTADRDLSDGLWHHFCLTWDGAVLRTYRDGVVSHEETIEGSDPAKSVIDQLSLGRQGDTHQAGIVDELRFSAGLPDQTNLTQIAEMLSTVNNWETASRLNDPEGLRLLWTNQGATWVLREDETGIEIFARFLKPEALTKLEYLNHGGTTGSLLNYTVVPMEEPHVWKVTGDRVAKRIIDSLSNFSNLSLDAGTLGLVSGSLINDAQGTIMGRGLIDVQAASFSNDGILRPAPPAVARQGTGLSSITIQGDLTLGSTSQMEILNISPNPIPQVDVIGTLNFDGSILMTFDPGYTPLGGDSFQLMSYSTGVGVFSNTQLPTPVGGISFQINQTPNQYFLNVLGESQVGFSSSTYSIDETDEAAKRSVTITVDRTGDTSRFAEVGYFTVETGTAVRDVDFLEAKGTLQFNPGETSQTFTVQAIDDRIIEGDEFFDLQLNNPLDCTIIAGTATMTITDIEEGEFTLDASSYSVTEDGISVTVEVQRVNGSSGAVTVEAFTLDGSAIAGNDYSFVPPSLSWADGDSTSRTFNIDIIDNFEVEGPETFTINLSNPSGNAILGGISIATITIEDVELGEASFISETYTVDEGGGTASIEIQRLNGSNGELTVQFSTADGTATVGDDYQDGTQLVSFPDTVTSFTATFNIADDPIVEGPETVLLSLSSTPQLLPLTSATLTIIDNEQPGTIRLSKSTVSTSEGVGNLSLTLLRENGADGEVSVTVQTVGGGTATPDVDYTSTPVVVNFANGVTSAEALIPILEDNLVEGSETFGIQLALPTGGATLGTPSTGTVTILDNDQPPGEVRFTATSVTGLENGGPLSFDVERINGSGGEVSVVFTTLTRSPGVGNAEPGSDYETTTITLTWADGVDGIQSVQVPLTNNNVPEPTESFDVELNSPTGGLILGTPSQAIGIIEDDDVGSPGTIRIEQLAYSLTEGEGTFSLAVQRVGGSSGAAVVHIQSRDDSATAGSDYDALNQDLTFADFDSAPKSVTLTIRQDQIPENTETFFLDLTLVSGTPLGLPSTSVVSITDDDSNLVHWSQRSVQLNEGDGSIEITAELETPALTALDVPFSTSTNATASSSDYTLSASVLSFAAGAQEASVTLDVVDDNLVESTEFVNLNLIAGTAGLGSPSTLTLDIGDNDETTLNWGIMPTDVTEGVATKADTSVTVQAEITQPFARRTVVNFRIDSASTATVGLDYRLAQTQLAFEAGETVAQTTLTVLDDRTVENDETLILILPEQPDVLLGELSTHTFTMHDNDSASVSWLNRTLSVTEDDTDKRSVQVDVVAQLSALTSHAVQVDYTVEGLATFGEDHDLQPGSITFPAGSDSATLSFRVIGDLRREPNEDVLVSLVDGEVALGTPSTFTLNIIDNDQSQAPDTDILVLDPTTTSPDPQLTVELNQTVRLQGLAIDPIGTGPYTFAWERCNADGCTQTTGETQDFTFTELGVYRVHCYATDGNGNPDLTPKVLLVHVRETLPPVVAIVEPAESTIDVLVGTRVDFTATIETSSKREVTTSWGIQGLEDPGILTIDNLNVSKIFDEVGTYNLIFEATDGLTSASDSRLIHVFDEDLPPRFVIAEPAAESVHRVGTMLTCVGEKMNQGNKDDEFIWVWDLGPDGEEVGQIADHQFAEAGTHQIRLLIFEKMEDGSRGEMISEDIIQIYVQDPEASPDITFGFPTNFRLQPSSSKLGQSCLYLNSIVLDNKGYEDLTFVYEVPGAQLNHETPGKVCFEQEGEYTVSLYAITPSGKQSVVQRRTVTVKASSDAEFEPNDGLDAASELVPGDYANLSLDENDAIDTYRVKVPAKGQRMVVKLDIQGEALLEIMDHSGNTIGEPKNISGSDSVSLAGLAAGDYFLKISQPIASKRRGLSMSISIGVLNPALYFPEIRTDNNYDTQIGIVNPTNELTCLEVVGFSANGTIIDEIPVELSPKGRRHLSIRDLFGNLASQVAWAQVDSVGEVVGYARTNSRDNKDLTAVSANRELFSELTVPHIAEKTDEWYTRATVINGDAAGLNGQVTLPRSGENTSLKLETPFKQDVFEFVERFDTLPDTQLWAKLDSESRAPAMAGVTVFGTRDQTRRSASLGLSDVSRDNPQFTFVQNNLYFTHVARGDFYTGLALVNLGELAQGVVIHAYRDNGSEVGDGLTKSLSGHEKLLTTASALLELMKTTVEEVAWILVEADADITGFEIFGRSKGLAGIEASRALRSEICYPFVDTDPSVGHGISIVNVNDFDITATVTLYDNNGLGFATKVVPLAPREKILSTLVKMFPDFDGHVPGWLEASSGFSSKPLAGFELFITEEQMGAVVAE